MNSDDNSSKILTTPTKVKLAKRLFKENQESDNDDDDDDDVLQFEMVPELTAPDLSSTTEITLESIDDRLFISETVLSQVSQVMNSNVITARQLFESVSNSIMKVQDSLGSGPSEIPEEFLSPQLWGTVCALSKAVAPVEALKQKVEGISTLVTSSVSQNDDLVSTVLSSVEFVQDQISKLEDLFPSTSTGSTMRSTNVTNAPGGATVTISLEQFQNLERRLALLESNNTASFATGGTREGLLVLYVPVEQHQELEKRVQKLENAANGMVITYLDLDWTSVDDARTFLVTHPKAMTGFCFFLSGLVSVSFFLDTYYLKSCTYK